MFNKKRYITLPEDWDELTEADWQELLKIRHMVATTDHQWTVEDVRIESARAMLRSRGARQQLNNPQWLLLVSQLAESLTWLWQQTDDGLSLVYRSTQQLIPVVTIGNGKERQALAGPLSHGEDLTFGEFRQAIQHLKAYESPAGQTEADRAAYRTTALCALAGLLYRREATPEEYRQCQQRRVPYDWDTLEEKIRRGRQMKPWQLWGIYAWLAYFCEALTTSTFMVDGEEVSFAPLFEHPTPKTEGESAGGSLQQICLTLAESHVFGTARDVDRTPLLTVMQKLLMDYQTLMKLKKKKI